MTAPRHLVIVGRPGSGKGTQGARLARELGLAHLSTGAALRRNIERDTELGRLARPYVEEGGLVPDGVMLRVVEHALDSAEVRERGYLLDGFPRTAEQAAAFLDGRPTRLDAAIDLDLPAGEARRRLLARGRADDDPAVIDHRLALDAAEAAPLLELLDRAGLLRRIDGCGTEDEVFARILEAVGRE